MFSKGHLSQGCQNTADQLGKKLILNIQKSVKVELVIKSRGQKQINFSIRGSEISVKVGGGGGRLHYDTL